MLPLCLSSRASQSQLKTELDTDSSSGLNTTDVAQFVRHVLTVRNIGQRQFARGVLGLSQGTVSELLAKPKPWDRLSEKGRESYRRMYQWAVEQTGSASLCLDLAHNGETHLPFCTSFYFYFTDVVLLSFAFSVTTILLRLVLCLALSRHFVK